MSNHKHGHYRSPTYYSWAAMKSRCTQPKDGAYKNYGAKGVRVAERWMVFSNFLEDMGERPAGCTLGRHGDQGHYEPGNVSWQTKQQQARYFCRNPRGKLSEEQVECIISLAKPGHKGVPNYAQIAKDLGVSASTISEIVKRHT